MRTVNSLMFIHTLVLGMLQHLEYIIYLEELQLRMQLIQSAQISPRLIRCFPSSYSRRLFRFLARSIIDRAPWTAAPTRRTARPIYVEEAAAALKAIRYCLRSRNDHSVPLFSVKVPVEIELKYPVRQVSAIRIQRGPTTWWTSRFFSLSFINNVITARIISMLISD